MGFQSGKRTLWLGAALLLGLFTTERVDAAGSKQADSPSLCAVRGDLVNVRWRGVEAASGDNADEQVLRFMAGNENELALPDGSECWSIQNSRSSKASTVYLLARTIEGVPVLGDELRIRRTRNGEFKAAYGKVTAETVINARLDNPVMTESGAVAAAETVFGGEFAWYGSPKVFRRTMPDGADGWKNVWVVQRMSSSPPGDWRMVVDDLTGEVLEFAEISAHTDVPAWVFFPDPITTSGAVYGQAGFKDSLDNDSPQLRAEQVSVQLRDVVEVSGGAILTGPYVSIGQWGVDWIVDSTLISLDEGINVGRDSSLFEKAMCYFHIDSLQRYIQSLGFDTLQCAPIKVDPHYDDQDQSQYNPTGNVIWYGDGNVDDAEDADVITHEYTHALYYDVFYGVSSGGPADELSIDIRSVAEGYCDYIAGNWSERLYPTGTDSVFNWDGHNEFWEGRLLRTDDDYEHDWDSTASADIYRNGTIWADALWQIRGELGGEITDAVVLESMFYHSAQDRAPNVASGLLEAAEDLYSSDPNIKMVAEAALVDKGFLKAVSAEEPAPPAPQRFEISNAYPNPFNSATTVNLVLPVQQELKLRVYSIEGRLVSERKLGSLAPGRHRISWRADAGTASGVYLLAIEGLRSGRVVKRVVYVR